MASLEQLATGTANEALSRGWPYIEADLRASGFQPPPGLRGPKMLEVNSKFNGGIASRIVARLERGDRVYRFSDTKRATTREARAEGFWWFDQETYLTLRKLSPNGDDQLREAARNTLAVLPEWGDMGNLVRGKVAKDFWCFKGMSAAAEGKSAKIVGPFTLDVLQIFVPGGLRISDLEDVSDSVLTRIAY